MQYLLILDSDSETEDMVLEELIPDDEDAKRERLEAKQVGWFSLDSKSDAWCVEHCR